jgi:uncharacterized membrane protein YgcG
VQSRMRNGRTSRTVRRGVVLAVIGWLVALGGSVLAAPAAVAAPSADVVIRDLTPPLVSIDPGGTVNFSNGIVDKTVQVGGGGLLPSLVTVVVHTDVVLTLPSGNHPLQPGQTVSEKFPSSCLVGCAITYTYRAEVPGSSLVGSVLTTVTGKALATLPQNQVVTYNGQQTTVTLGVPTPFLVNTILPNLPNLPSINLPQLPAITVPLPQAPSVPALPGTGPTTGATTPGADPGVVGVTGIGGPTYNYGTAAGAARMAPGSSAGTAFTGAGSGASSSEGGGTGSGSGGLAGGNDGADVPGFGQLAGLDQPLDENGRPLDVASDAADLSTPQLSVPALLAVIAFAGSTAALVRARRAQRAG